MEEWQRDRGSHPAQAMVRHGGPEWAREDHGDGRREVHCHPGEGAGAARRTDVRAFRGVHQRYLPRYVATYEAWVHAKQVTPTLSQRMCIRALSAHASYT